MSYKYRIIWVIGIILLFLNASIAQEVQPENSKGKDTKPSPSPAYPVKWSPASLKITIAVGTKYSTEAVLSSDRPLTDLVLSVVPELSSYLTVEPSVITSLGPNSPASIRINVHASGSASIGPLVGTIHVKKGKAIFPQTLKVELNIVKPSVIESLSTKTYFTQISSMKVTSNIGIIIDEPAVGFNLNIPPSSFPRDTTVTISEVNNPPLLPTGLKFVSAPIQIEPNGFNLNSPVLLRITYTERELSNAGIKNESSISLFSFDENSGKWAQCLNANLDTSTNTMVAELTHFSHYVLVDVHPDLPPENLGIPRKGDLVYKMSSVGYNGCYQGWYPGHVGIYTAERAYLDPSKPASDYVKTHHVYNVIEALPGLTYGVQYSYYAFPNITTSQTSPPEFAATDCYMGARQPNKKHGGPLTDAQRDLVLEFAEQEIGKPYAWGQTVGVFYGLLEGEFVKGPNSFNCVGLAEAAYEYAGVNSGAGLVRPENESGECVTTLCPPFSARCCPSSWWQWPNNYDWDALTVAEQYAATDAAELPSKGEYQSDANTVALWHFNEPTGNTVGDATGNGNNGIASGTTIVDGKFGKARLFAGTDHIDIPSSASLNLPDQFTVEAWISINSIDGDAGVIIDNGSTGYRNYNIGVLPDGRICGGTHNASGEILLYTPYTFQTGKFYHVALTLDGSVLKLYVNGIMIGQKDASGPYTTNTGNLGIGYIPAGCCRYYFHGIIDEMRISNKARTPDEFNVPPKPSFERLYQLPSGAGIVEYGGDNILYFGDHSYQIAKLNLSTGTLINYINAGIVSPLQQEGRGIAFDGTTLWYAEWRLRMIYQLDAVTGNVIKSFPSPGSGPQGLTWDGTYLWHTDEYSKLIYKISPVDGSVVATFPVPDINGYFNSIAYHDGHLWVGNHSTNNIYELDMNGNVLFTINFPDYHPQSLTCDATYLYMGTEFGPLYRMNISNISTKPHLPVINISENIPNEFALLNNFPNPFNPTTAFKYQLPSDSRVSLKIYNVLGQPVKVLTDNIETAGYKLVQWDASNVASGMYFYRLEAVDVNNPANNFVQVRKMILLK